MAKTKRNNALYEDHKKNKLNPAALGKKYEMSRQQAAQIIQRIADQRGEELRQMGRKKKYDAVLPVTPATTEQRAFADAFAKFHGINISDVMRLCVANLEESQTVNDRRAIAEIEKALREESIAV